MTSYKKGIIYKTSNKALKNMINDKLYMKHQFATKKEHKEAVKCIMEETKSLFEKGIVDYLDINNNNSIDNFFLKNKKNMKANVKVGKKVNVKGSIKS
jgi:hypothetical protein